MEAFNVSLKLTEDKEVLEELRARGALVRPSLPGKKKQPDMSKPEVYAVQFDSRTISFSPGKVVTLPHNIAQSVVNYRPLMGGDPAEGFWGGRKHEYKSALNADWTQVFEVVETWAVGDEAPSAAAAKATMCYSCQPPRDMVTLAALAAHLAEHQEDEAIVPVGAGTGKPAKTAGAR